jgi:hypothetical protein
LRHSNQPVAGTKQRRCNKSRKIGFWSRVSARALISGLFLLPGYCAFSTLWSVVKPHLRVDKTTTANRVYWPFYPPQSVKQAGLGSFIRRCAVIGRDLCRDGDGSDRLHMYFSASVTGQVALVDKSAYISKTDQCLARDIVLQTVWMAPDRVSLRIDV